MLLLENSNLRISLEHNFETHIRTRGQRKAHKNELTLNLI